MTPLSSISILHHHLFSPHDITKARPHRKQDSQTAASMDLELSSNRSGLFGPSRSNTLDRNSTPNEPAGAPYATEDDSPDEDSICCECRQVDWDNFHNVAESLREHQVYQAIRNVEDDYEQLAASSCKICRLLPIVMPRSLGNPETADGVRFNLVFHAYPLPHRCTTGSKITALQVCPYGTISPWKPGDNCLVAIKRDGEDFASRTINPTSIDYDWLRRLTRSCEQVHDCKPSSPGPVSGLQVIEVSSRTVVQAPADCKYVALSYVWGKQRHLDLTLCLQRPPTLIEDAMSVTVAMGYNYLWVDKYVSPCNTTKSTALIQI